MDSASELEYHLLLVKDLNLIPLADYDELSPRATELKRMLTALIQRLQTNRKLLIADRWPVTAPAGRPLQSRDREGAVADDVETALTPQLPKVTAYSIRQRRRPG
jgi:hypothetical protein